jgi:D-alanyl-D-alanine carboxypeptidase
MRNILLLLLLLSLSISGTAQKISSQKVIIKDILNIARTSHLPTLQILMTVPGDTLRLNYVDPHVNDVDIYGIGSTTKLLVAVMVMDLVEQDLLKLTDPASRFLENCTENEFLKGISVRDLLQHTSGIQDYTRDKNWGTLVWKNQTPATFEERRQLIDKEFVAQNKFHYSNSNYLILEKIVEKVTNVSYHVAFNQFYQDHGLDTIRMMIGKDDTQAFFAQDKGVANDITKTQEVYGYAGDAQASAIDLARFIDKLFIQKSILKETSLALLQNWISMKPTIIPVGKGKLHKYGLGIMQLEFGKDNYIGHSGGTLKYQSFLFYRPEDNLIITAITNCSGQHYNKTFVQEIIPAILKRI